MSTVTLATPSANGVGASSNTNTLSPSRTINVAGTLVGTILIEVSDDNSNWAQVAAFFRAGVQVIQSVSRWMRVRVSGYVSGTSVTSITNIPTTSQLAQDHLDAFGQIRTTKKTLRINALPTYGLSALRNAITLTGSATAAEAGGEGVITLTASGTDGAKVDTNTAAYAVGRTGEAGTAIRIPTAPTGAQAYTWGMFDDNNGFCWGYKSTGFVIATRKGGVDTEVLQADWNVDTMDGNGPSGENLATAIVNGVVFHIEYVWSPGVITYELFLPNSDGVQVKIPAHRVFDYASPIVVDPQLPIRIEAQNNGDATTGALHFGGRQFSTIGDYVQFFRYGQDTRVALASIGTTPVPLVSFRRKATLRGRPVTIPVFIEGFDVVTDADAIISVWVNGVLTGESWGTPTGILAAETGCEADIAATAINVSAANKLYEGLVNSAQGKSTSLATGELLNLAILDTDIVTLAIRSVTGTLGATATFRWREEW